MPRTAFALTLPHAACTVAINGAMSTRLCGLPTTRILQEPCTLRRRLVQLPRLPRLPRLPLPPLPPRPLPRRVDGGAGGLWLPRHTAQGW